MRRYIERLARCITRIDGKYYDLAKSCSAGENEVYVLYSLAGGQQLAVHLVHPQVLGYLVGHRLCIAGEHDRLADASRL